MAAKDSKQGKAPQASPWCMPPEGKEFAWDAARVPGNGERPGGGRERPEVGGFVCLSCEEFDAVASALSKAMAVCDFLIAYGDAPNYLESEETPSVFGYFGMDALKSADYIMSGAGRGNPVAVL